MNNAYTKKNVNFRNGRMLHSSISANKKISRRKQKQVNYQALWCTLNILRHFCQVLYLPIYFSFAVDRQGTSRLQDRQSQQNRILANQVK